ncbi:CLUMA_CG019482, isoform A [Clunio marinus]|uniref:CLUMA_CG019482, isoform A n=1 Tax=Clunio marinus TaxID=568069 RepID=A0A1J1J7H4_9DIPT|nr:CLUMA_CG019482, isoform A [Clunio marinus]
MHIAVILAFHFFCAFECLAKPVEQGSVTDPLGEVTPYPDTQKQFIDINNVSPEVSNILIENNMNLEKIKTMLEKLQNKTMSNKNFYEVIPSSTSSPSTEAKDMSEFRLNSIKTSLEKTLRQSDDNAPQTNAEFDYALPAVCEVPRHFNLSDWFGHKTWNIFFKPNYRQYNVKSVFLRIKSNFNGWVEIDALLTLKYWDHPRNNYGIAIDIFDDEENQLDAKEHFHLQNCEAGVQVPWRAFNLLAKSIRTPVSEDDVEVYRSVHTGPRLDIISSSPAKYLLNSSETQQSQQKPKRLRHIHNPHHLQKSSEEYPESFENYFHDDAINDHSHNNKKVEET